MFYESDCGVLLCFWRERFSISLEELDLWVALRALKHLTSILLQEKALLFIELSGKFSCSNIGVMRLTVRTVTPRPALPATSKLVDKTEHRSHQKLVRKPPPNSTPEVQ